MHPIDRGITDVEGSEEEGVHVSSTEREERRMRAVDPKRRKEQEMKEDTEGVEAGEEDISEVVFLAEEEECLEVGHPEE